MTAKIPLSSHVIGDAFECRRYWQYKHILRRVPKGVATSLFLGRIWHELMEIWWAGEGEDRWTDADKVLQKYIDTKQVDPYDGAKLQAMLMGYHARWHEGGYKLVHSEMPFVMPIVNPEDEREHHDMFVYCGQIDKIAEDKAGNLLFAEHKTTSDDAGAGSDYWKRLTVDLQVSGYYLGAEHELGKKVAYCLYDVAAKPAQRPLKATPADKRKTTKDGKPYANQRLEDESPGEYGVRIVESIKAEPDKFFVRGEITRLDKQIEAVRYDIWDAANMLGDDLVAGRFPRNTKACRRPSGKMCEYFDVCAGDASIDDDTRFTASSYKPAGGKLPTVQAATVSSFELDF